MEKPSEKVRKMCQKVVVFYKRLLHTSNSCLPALASGIGVSLPIHNIQIYTNSEQTQTKQNKVTQTISMETFT